MTRIDSMQEWLCVSRVFLNPGDHERPYRECPAMFVPRTDTGTLAE